METVRGLSSGLTYAKLFSNTCWAQNFWINQRNITMHRLYISGVNKLHVSCQLCGALSVVMDISSNMFKHAHKLSCRVARLNFTVSVKFRWMWPTFIAARPTLAPTPPWQWRRETRAAAVGASPWTCNQGHLSLPVTINVSSFCQYWGNRENYTSGKHQSQLLVSQYWENRGNYTSSQHLSQLFVYEYWGNRVW